MVHLTVLYPGVAVDIGCLLQTMDTERLKALILELVDESPGLKEALLDDWNCADGAGGTGRAQPVIDPVVELLRAGDAAAGSVEGQVVVTGRVRTQRVRQMLDEGMSMSAIAKAMNISKGRVSQINAEQKTARGARQPSASRPADDAGGAAGDEAAPADDAAAPARTSGGDKASAESDEGPREQRGRRRTLALADSQESARGGDKASAGGEEGPREQRGRRRTLALTDSEESARGKRKPASSPRADSSAAGLRSKAAKALIKRPAKKSRS